MKQGYPTIEEANRILEEAEGCNPGPWGGAQPLCSGMRKKNCGSLRRHRFGKGICFGTDA